VALFRAFARYLPEDADEIRSMSDEAIMNRTDVQASRAVKWFRPIKLLSDIIAAKVSPALPRLSE
jgi:hypothetical protein